FTALSWVMPEFVARSIIGWLGWGGMIAIAWMLSRVLPWTAVPGADPSADPTREPLTIAVRTAAILTVSWLITSPYTLSWYDLTAWVPLALLASTRLDALLMWRGAWLSVAYVTGRAVQFSDGMKALAFVVRDILCSGAQILVIVLVVLWWWRDGHELPSFSVWRHRWHAARHATAPATD
ncbi:MAG: hypothetical protein WAQ75_01670, partial [Propionicimonas sp.]